MKKMFAKFKSAFSRFSLSSAGEALQGIGNGFIKTLRFFGYLIISLFAGFGLGWIGVAIDLLFNPWIRSMEWTWINVFTTKHYLTYDYLNGGGLWFAMCVIVSIFILIQFIMRDED